jgi:SAM-dependent methyltransferase
MKTDNTNLREWEEVEIKRSDSEAKHIDLKKLRIPEREVIRYRNPSKDTCHPLEYSYYLLGDVRGKTILDIGCGSGRNSILLVNRGATIYGLDISDSLIQLARKRLEEHGIKERVNFVVGSAHDIPFDNDSVDIVFGIAILHHLDLKAVSKEVKRILRKGGRAIFREPVRNSKTIKFVRRLIPYQEPDISPFERPLTDIELEEFADGFSSYHSRAFWLPYVNLVQVLMGFNRLHHFLSRIDAKLLKKFPSLGYYASIRVIELTK